MHVEVTKKKCNCCKKYLNLYDFYRCIKNFDGLKNVCKSCSRKNMKTTELEILRKNFPETRHHKNWGCGFKNLS